MRADKFFADKFSSRTKAAEAIEKGLVKVDGKIIKPSDEISGDEEMEFLEPEEYFVSNGGYKLSKALKAFGYDCNGRIFADIGASTGGFTDCLLQNGAKKVYCVDVGESQLDPSIAERKEVFVMDNTNARYLTKSDFDEHLDGCVIDVSFISLKYILPVAESVLSDGGVVFALIKPQFECEKKGIGKSGIVKREAHAKIVSSICEFARAHSLSVKDIVNAPLREKKNIEYIIYLEKGVKSGLSVDAVLKKISVLS